MTGMYIFGGVALAGLLVLIIFKIKWGRESRKEANAWQDRIASDRDKEIKDQESRKS